MSVANLIDGRAVAGQIQGELTQRIAALKSRGIQPGLAFVRVGEDAASKVYVGRKEKTSAELGIVSETHVLAESTTEADLLKLIAKLNADPHLHGILVQAPLQKHIRQEIVYASVLPEKDVDGFHPVNVGKLMLGDDTGFKPCTPAGVLELIIRSDTNTDGAEGAVAVGCLVFALLGLVVFRKVLAHFFNDRWTAFLLLLIGFGTNWFQLTAWDGTLLTHPALFTLYAWLLLATIRWHHRPSWAQAIQIGAALGLITLVRPSELVVVLIPLLWGLHAAVDRGAKWKAISAHPLHLLGAVAAFALAVAPQLFYWHATTGKWLFYSYVNPGEGFDFATPHLRPFLISFRKGWFVYTPLMLFAILGIAALWKRIPQAFGAVLFFLLVDLWIVSSWSCWWYAGGSFSARSMVPAYVLLALPLGAFLQWTWERKTLRAPLLVTCSAFVVLNLLSDLAMGGWHPEQGTHDESLLQGRVRADTGSCRSRAAIAGQSFAGE